MKLQQGRENMNMWYWVLGFKWRGLYQPSPLSVKLNWKNLICKLFIILELNDWRSVLTDDLSAVGLHFECLRDDNGNAIPQPKLLECRMAVWLKWHPSFSEVTLFYTHKINGMIICQMSPFKIYVLLQKSIHNFLWTSISLGDIKINCA